MHARSGSAATARAGVGDAAVNATERLCKKSSIENEDRGGNNKVKRRLKEHQAGWLRKFGTARKSTMGLNWLRMV